MAELEIYILPILVKATTSQIYSNQYPTAKIASHRANNTILLYC